MVGLFKYQTLVGWEMGQGGLEGGYHSATPLVDRLGPLHREHLLGECCHTSASVGQNLQSFLSLASYIY